MIKGTTNEKQWVAANIKEPLGSHTTEDCRSGYDPLPGGS